jgi:4a-hydroxytetrahydrobiopterin dehydratase
MARPIALDRALVEAWLKAHSAWQRTDIAIVRQYPFADFASGLAFVVRVGCLAEKRDHHPDVELRWGSVRLTWTTHDAGGVTSLDLEAAEAADAIAG